MLRISVLRHPDETSIQSANDRNTANQGDIINNISNQFIISSNPIPKISMTFDKFGNNNLHVKIPKWNKKNILELFKNYTIDNNTKITLNFNRASDTTGRTPYSGQH